MTTQPKKRVTQHDRVRWYLEEHIEGITQKEATDLFGATRLAAIIFDLRQQGLNIETLDEKGKNRYGDKTRYGRYILYR